MRWIGIHACEKHSISAMDSGVLLARGGPM